MNNDLVANYAGQIIPILERYRVPKAAFFGSLVSEQFRDSSSDVDLLVLPPQGMSLLGFVALKQDIEDVIHREVDLVSYRGLSPYLKDRILSQERVFYEAKH